MPSRIRSSFSRRAGLLMLCLGAALAGSAQADGSDVVVDPILSTTETSRGQPIVLPQGEAQVQVSRYVIPPGAQLPVHKHPFPRMAYVLSGTLIVTDVEAGTETTFAEGEFVVEMVDAWHFGRNSGTEPLELLVIDLGHEGQPNTIAQDQ